MNGYFLTNQGRVRSHNEDAGGIFENSSKQILAVVADGMGGHKAGDVASNMVITHLKERWKETEYLSTPEQAESWLASVILETNNAIFTHAQQHEECQGMGTTVVAVITTDDFISIAHIGDSRCYLYNDQGFKQITEDHSLVNELVRNGQISKEDAEYHPRKNVLLKALGTEKDCQADIKTIGWEKNNLLVLCSDGLTNKVSDEQLQESLHTITTLEDKAQSLVDEANNRGGEDNISVAFVHYLDSEEEGES